MSLGKTERLFISRRFLRFFVSQSFVSCGAFIQVVAAARQLVVLTDSGLLTGFSVVCAPLPGVLLSLAAGNLGDRLRAGKLLVLFDGLRGCLVLLYSCCRSAPALIVVMMLSGVLDVLYSPSRNKTLTAVLGREELLRGNSLLNGGYGAVSLVMPALTGVLLGAFGISFIFYICSAFYFLSALTLATLDAADRPEEPARRRPGELLKGLRYCFGNAPVRRAVLTLAVVDFGTVSVNIAFYSFAFDTLKVTSAYWGLLLSVLYGMNIFAMLFLMRRQKKLTARPFVTAGLSLVLVASAWAFYATTRSLPAILIGAAAEGFGSALVSTLLVTTMLKASRQDWAARVTGARDLCSYAAKLLGIGFTYGLMRLTGVRTVFLAGAGVLLVCALIQIPRREVFGVSAAGKAPSERRNSS